MIVIPRKLATPDEPGTFFVLSDDLGWAPGCFPEEVRFGNRLMVRMVQGADSATYGSMGKGRKNINLIVSNV